MGTLYGLALLPCHRLNLIILSKLMFWDALAIIGHLFINQMSLKLSICSWSTEDTLRISHLQITEEICSLWNMETSVLGCSWHSENSKDNAISPRFISFLFSSLSSCSHHSHGSPLQLECSAQYLCVQWSQTVQWSHILSSLSYWQQVWDLDSSGILIPECKQVFFLPSTLYHLILENK